MQTSPLRPASVQPPAPARRRPLAVVLALAAALAAALLLPLPASAEVVVSRHYSDTGLAPYALEALLWDHCPDDLQGRECVVGVEDGKAFMAASPAVHRGVVVHLAELERSRSSRPLRVDLVIADPASSDRLDGLPESARAALEGLRPQWAGSGLVLLDSATVNLLGRADTRLTAGDRTFTAHLHLRTHAYDDTPIQARLSLTHQGGRSEPSALNGSILDTTVSLSPTTTTLAGTTHYTIDGPELIVLLTPEG